MAGRVSWRWLFWSTSIFQAVMMVVSYFSFQETYAPVLLQRKAGVAAREQVQLDRAVDEAGEGRGRAEADAQPQRRVFAARFGGARRAADVVLAAGEKQGVGGQRRAVGASGGFRPGLPRHRARAVHGGHHHVADQHQEEPGAELRQAHR